MTTLSLLIYRCPLPSPPLPSPPLRLCSRFDKFTATLARTSEVAPQKERDDEAGAAGEGDNGKDNPKPNSAATTAATASASEADFGATVSSSSSPTGARGDAGGGKGGEGEGGAVEAGKRATGKEWLQTHPHGTPPTMRLAMQFDQVCCTFRMLYCKQW